MTTILKLGPSDHGRPLTLDEFDQAETNGGFLYELIRGRVYVSPEANFPHVEIEMWLLEKLFAYRRAHPEVVRYASNKARVFIPGESAVTAAQPDLAVYRDFPSENRAEVRWQDVSPLLVAEIVSPGAPDKDFIRNVELYLQVPSIREYWIFDSRAGHANLHLHVHHRHGRTWRRSEVGAGARYTTRLLPDFELVLDLTT